MSSFVKLGRIRFFYIPSNMCHLAVQLFNSCVPYWMDVFTRNWDESPTPINTIQKKNTFICLECNTNFRTAAAN